MNSARPLITITILAIVGAWLYVKINEGPTQPAHDDAEAWHDHAAPDVPPLATTINVPPAATSLAPQSPNVAATAPATATATPSTNVPAAVNPPATGVDATGLSELPAVPALPDVSAVSAPPAIANVPPTALQPNFPTARYSGVALENDPAAVNSYLTTSTQPADSMAPNVIGADAVANQSPPATSAIGAEHQDTAAANSAMARVGLTPQPTITPDPDRGAAGVSVPPVADPLASPVELSFAAAWPMIQASLDRGELAKAHQLLSQWYGDESLSPVEAERVESLLGQLAGTVVYSTEHQLEPAYIVRSGETLDSIAKAYNVNWQLLAKINGISSPDAVQPGQQLKIIRGPFSALVDLRRSQLTLMLDNRYAGKFPITVPYGTTIAEGKWLVDQIAATSAKYVTQTAYTGSGDVFQFLLRAEDAKTGKPLAEGPTLAIVSTLPSGAASDRPMICITPQDAADLSDILSVGSRVVIRR